MRFFGLFERMLHRNAFCRSLFVIGIGCILAFVESGQAIDAKIAFGSDRDGNSEIYVMESDGTNPVRLTQNPAVDAYPAWSPDGTKIAFTSTRRNGFTWEIYVMNTDGTKPVRRRQTTDAFLHTMNRLHGRRMGSESCFKRGTKATMAST